MRLSCIIWQKQREEEKESDQLFQCMSHRKFFSNSLFIGLLQTLRYRLCVTDSVAYRIARLIKRFDSKPHAFDTKSALQTSHSPESFYAFSTFELQRSYCIERDSRLQKTTCALSTREYLVKRFVSNCAAYRRLWSLICKKPINK